MNSAKRYQIFRRLQAQNPHPTTELNYRNNFELLVAVVLSAQSTDKAVNRATKNLFRIAPDPASMLTLGIEGLRDTIKTIGLYNSKAANIIGLCEDLLALHDGNVPHDRSKLEALPGVGRKTANVVLNTAFGEPTIAVDTHIFRISNRIGLAPGKSVNEVERLLMNSVPKEFLKDAHHWLILHGRYTCTARKPLCGSCIIEDLCEFPDRSAIAQAQTTVDHNNKPE